MEPTLTKREGKLVCGQCLEDWDVSKTWSNFVFGTMMKLPNRAQRIAVRDEFLFIMGRQPTHTELESILLEGVTIEKH